MVETLKEFGPYGFTLLILAGAFVFVLRRKDPAITLLKEFLDHGVKASEARDKILTDIRVDIGSMKDRVGCKYERPRS